MLMLHGLPDTRQIILHLRSGKLWPTPQFLPKFNSLKFVNEDTDLASFYEGQSAECSLLCPVDTLW